jgi:hypothetical protein
MPRRAQPFKVYAKARSLPLVLGPILPTDTESPSTASRPMSPSVALLRKKRARGSRRAQQSG